MKKEQAEKLDNSVKEAIIYLNEPQVNVHGIYKYLLTKYPDYIGEMGEANRARQSMSYSMRRVMLEGKLLKKIGKAHGSIAYEYLQYDRTPVRGDGDAPSVLETPPLLVQPAVPVVTEIDRLLEMNQRLHEQNERLLDAIVSLVK